MQNNHVGEPGKDVVVHVFNQPKGETSALTRLRLGDSILDIGSMEVVVSTIRVFVYITEWIYFEQCNNN